MNTTQTSPARTLSPAAHTLLTDFDDPDLSELDLADRHGLTLDQLRSAAAAPAFRHALAIIRELQALRRPFILARAEADAAHTLTTLTARDPTSATAAKEVRLAVKALLDLLGGPARRAGIPSSAASHGGADFQSAIRAQPEPLNPPTPSTPPNKPSGGGGVGAGGAAPTPQSTTSPTPPTPTRTPSHTPKRPRNTKPRPKARSR